MGFTLQVFRPSEVPANGKTATTGPMLPALRPKRLRIGRDQQHRREENRDRSHRGKNIHRGEGLGQRAGKIWPLRDLQDDDTVLSRGHAPGR